MREKIQDGMLEKLRRRQTLGKTPKNPAIIENGWKKCGIADALANGAPSDDPFVPI